MYRIHELPIDSALLRNNPAGDPHERRLFVLAPEDHDPNRPTPAIWMFPGLGSSQGSFLADDPWKEGLARRASRLVSQGAMPPVLFALPDTFTRFGGSQFIDSAATGPYERHLWEELAPAVEERFRVSAWGAAGHSSGGYGALVHAMRRPDKVKAAACHAGDMMFDVAYRPDFPKAATQINRFGGVEKLMAAFEAAPKKQDGRWMSALNAVAMAACYSPDPMQPLGIALPFDLETCELVPEVWARWLEHDPVHMLEKPAHRDALKQLSLLFIDAGSRDEWNLHWAARGLRKRLVAHGIEHVYEEFDDGHMGTSYRFDRSLPLLAKALTQQAP